MTRRLSFALVLATLVSGLPFGSGAAPLAGQDRIRDLVITTGFAAERYSGNLASVTVPVVDSTNRAASLIGEVGLRSTLLLFEGERSRLTTSFDLGLRQFVADGFGLRDYSPREKAARADVSLLQSLGSWGDASLVGAARMRSVDDRPPMPLYLQASFDQYTATARWQSPVVSDFRIDLRLDAERSDYDATGDQTQLRLLDRRAKGAELGVTWGTSGRFRLFTQLRRTDYTQQASFDETDPFRRDRTVQVGGTWSYASSFLAEVGLVGTMNRSNSRRPEYDAISLTGDFAVPLPFGGLNLNLYGALTEKSYIQETDFARLVPGEEADNASIVFVDLNRAVANNLNATVRFGWTRAETDIGDSYYERWGVSVFMNWRPLLR